MVRYFRAVRSLLLALAGVLMAIPGLAADRIPVVATFSVIGDMLANVGGDHVDIRTIVRAGSDCELYQATPADVATVRRVAPRAPILLPGVGAQAGDLERSVQAGVDADGGGILVNASRTVLYASPDASWQSAARAEAENLRSAINAARVSGATVPR